MTDSEADNGATLAWTVHPVKRRPFVSVAVSLFIVLVAVLIYVSTNSNAFTVLGLVIMMLSLAKFYFPTHYAMDTAGITIRTTTQTLKKKWSQYRSAYPDKNGVLLSPFTEPSRLENFRGLYVMFENNADEVKAFVQANLGRPDPEEEPTSAEQPENDS